MLKEILKNLQEGGYLNLSFTRNQYGEWIATDQLFFDKGWYLTQLNCWSSRWVGMGVCECNSHPTWWTEEITREYALRLIKNYIEEELQKTKRQMDEVEFLNKLIESL